MLVTAFVSCSQYAGKEADGNQSDAVAQTFRSGMNRITFDSEGVDLVGNLYLPENYQSGKTYPAVIVGGSWTTVKEQMAGLYAGKLAAKGFVSLAFDHRFYGESGGEPRFLERPSSKTEDFLNAIQYMKTLPFVAKEGVAGLAVCASGGYMADAIALGGEFSAFTAVVPWFNTDEIVNAFYGGPAGIADRIAQSKAATDNFEKNGQMDYIPAISDTDPNAAMFGPFDYYLDKNLGQVPNWSHDKFALASWEPWLTYRPLASAEKINIPTLIITSENAATPVADQAFYDKLQGPKELVWLEGGQLDFYHQEVLVNQSVELVAQFLGKSL